MSYIEGIFERLDHALSSVIGGFTGDGAPSSRKPEPDKLADYATEQVNGVAIPKNVADQLRRLGISLSWYSASELEAAIRACSVDCNLIDDPDGNNFMDALELDEHERHAVDEHDKDMYKLNTLRSNRGYVMENDDNARSNVFGEPQFRERIKWERERKKKALATAEELGESVKTVPGL